MIVAAPDEFSAGNGTRIDLYRNFHRIWESAFIEDGEGSDRVTGDGERERTESSDSSEENRSVSGELARPVYMHDAIAKGRRDVCVFAAGVEARTRLAATTVKSCKGSRVERAAQLRSQQQRLQIRQNARK